MRSAFHKMMFHFTVPQSYHSYGAATHQSRTRVVSWKAISGGGPQLPSSCPSVLLRAWCSAAAAGRSPTGRVGQVAAAAAAERGGAGGGASAHNSMAPPASQPPKTQLTTAPHTRLQEARQEALRLKKVAQISEAAALQEASAGSVQEQGLKAAQRQGTGRESAPQRGQSPRRGRQPAKALPPDGTSDLTVRDQLLKRGIILKAYTPGTHRLVCPECRGGTTGEESFAVTIENDGESAAWICHRASCGSKGGFNLASTAREGGVEARRQAAKQPVVRPTVKLSALTDPDLLSFFKERKIGAATLKRNAVAQTLRYSKSANSQVPAMAFPYFRGGELVNVKTRLLPKGFFQEKGAEPILYGINDLAGQFEAIIVEGEMDKLALEEAGLRNCVSVPNGAPARVREGKLPAEEADQAFAYLWNCRGVLDRLTRIVLATDNDPPGQALAEELARRLGRERCWRVHWPKSSKRPADPPGTDEGPLGQQFEGELTEQGMDLNRTSVGSTEAELEGDDRFRKDANEVLIRDGPTRLRELVEAAEPYPLRGLLRFQDFGAEVWRSYWEDSDVEQGASSGWKDLDEIYRVIPGELTVVTGVPNSGKSEWIDALLCNLAREQGWSFALCSMEKKAVDHLRQLMEKCIGKPFFKTKYGQGLPRMSAAEVGASIAWVNSRFHPIRYEDDALPSVDWVLGLARAAVLRYGIRGLVIDPYNELDHCRGERVSETEYVSQMLTKVKRFAQHNEVHVWFVAHPRQLQQWRGEAPNLYDISGSAHFVNKADNGLVIHRNRDPATPELHHQVQVLVRKVRNKQAGTIGECTLEYHRPTGRYYNVGEGPPR